MKHVKTRTYLTLLCAAILILGVLLSISFARTPVANASGQQYFPVEKYTDDDRLLLPDGTLSNRTIQNFAESVKKAVADFTVFPEITQVIPLQYLESQETNATFAYNGKEYGFYVSKKGNRFDVLLIDFVFEFDENDSNNIDRAFKIRIEPILQQSFERHNSNDGFYWTKSDEGSKYYVINPRFACELYNENALNYGDEGYAKGADEGTIISQTRINYAKVTGQSAVGELAKIGAKVLIGAVAAQVGVPQVSTILDLIEAGIDVYQAENNRTLDVNCENQIISNISKTGQNQDPSKFCYSRRMLVAPNDTVALSADNVSYAECITEIATADYKSRLIQRCEFDIGVRDIFGISYVTGCEENDEFSFYKERVLFEDQEPKFEISRNLDSPQQIYLLPHGEQEVCFVPKYPGTYSFDCPNQTEISLAGVTGTEFALEKDVKYVFKVKNKSNSPNERIIGQLSCFVPSCTLPKTVEVQSGGSELLRYLPDVSGYKNLKFTTPSVSVVLLDDKFVKITKSSDGNLSCSFKNGKTYYLYITNTSTESKSVSIVDAAIEPIDNANNLYIYDSNKVLRFKNSRGKTSQFTLHLITDKLGRSVSVCRENGGSLGTLITNSQGVNIVFSLDPNEICYFSFSHNDGSIRISIDANDLELKWKVTSGNTTYEGASIEVELARHDNEENATGYHIQLLEKKDGVWKENSNIALDLEYNYYSFDNGYLRIHYATPIGYDIRFNPVNIYGYTLKIRVTQGCKDIEHTITFDNAGATSGPNEMKLKYDSRVTAPYAPQKIGNTFLGYFLHENGREILIFDSAMNGPTVWKYCKDMTLHAHWEKIKYTVRLVADIGATVLTRQIQVTYGDPMPDLHWYYPERPGFSFVGYFSEPDRHGKQYYTMAIANDEQMASEMSYPCYWREKVVPCANWDKDDDGVLYAYYTRRECDYTFKDVVTNGPLLGNTTTHLVTGNNYMNTTTYEGYSFYAFDLITDKTTAREFGVVLVIDPLTKAIVPSVKFYALYREDNCLAEGTLITLADGRQVPVESLTGNEMLLVWNLKTGSFDSARILFIDTDATQIYKVINLGFSDGTNVKVISEHAFWDYNLNEYVYLREDAAKYIGHWFNKQITNPDGSMESVMVRLTSVDVRDEYTTAYSPVTYDHLCYYVNGMLSMPGGISGLFNIFEVNPDTMTIDYEAMARDIETYGLFTYEEFAELLPVPQDVFDAFNAQYFKIAIGKGLITMETLESLFVRYAEFLV